MSSVQDESPVQVTTDGEDEVIYNGVPDWVYEGIFTSSFWVISKYFANLEEVLGSGSALWFSPDGAHLVYAKFNDTNVDDFFYFVYGSPGEMEDQYPTVREIKYPKVCV